MILYLKQNKKASSITLFSCSSSKRKVPSMKFTDPSSKWRTHCRHKRKNAKTEIGIIQYNAGKGFVNTKEFEFVDNYGTKRTSKLQLVVPLME
jgi:hypothetical protein